MILFRPQFLYVAMGLHLLGFIISVVASAGNFAAAPILAVTAILNLLGMALDYALLTLRR